MGFTSIRSLYEWLTLKDYEKAKKRATAQIVSRFSRGNTSLQNGSYMDESELRDLTAAGDKAVENLRRRTTA